MAPLIITPEYVLLTKLVEGKQRIDSLNGIALVAAENEGYVRRIGDHVFITHDGYHRLEELDQ